MIYLILSILCSSAIFIIFKYFEKLKINTFGAIVINYFIASITGLITLGGVPSTVSIVEKPWLWNSLFLGVIFILLFNVMALTAQKLGPSVASIANKMALIIPVVFAIFYYGDEVNFLKIVGVILALIGVFLSTFKPRVKGKVVDKSVILIPVFLFLGSGFIDTFLKFNQEAYLNSNPQDAKLFPVFIFLTAFLIGIIIMLSSKEKRILNARTILGGLILGMINYGSIYFLIQIFNNTDLESSVVFPINNMGVVLATAIASLLIFKEAFTTKNKLGIGISILALILIIFST